MDKKGPIKSFILTGNLNQNCLIYKLCPVTELSEGVWNMTVCSVAYSCEIQNFEEFFQISCNLVKAQRFNDTSFEVESYNQPFGIFKLQRGKRIIYFGAKKE